MNLKNIIYCGFAFAAYSQPLFAQDDLMSLIKKPDLGNDLVIATFKSSRIINAQTTEVLKKGNLDFRIGHRFSDLSGGPGTFWGTDVTQDVRIAFEYGVTDNLTIGISRSEMDLLMEGFLKYKLLSQTVNNKVPVSIALFANSTINYLPASSDYSDQVFSRGFAHRMSYVYQGIIARKFNSSLSLEILPTWIQRNFIENPNDVNDFFSLGAGGRFKVTRSSAIVLDYFYNFRKQTNLFNPVTGQIENYYSPVGIGWEIETGGHVFTIMFSNAGGITENNFIPNTTDNFNKIGNYKWGFNISRIFKL